MSFADAEAALGDAIEAENAPVSTEQAVAPATPEGTSTPTEVQPHHAAQQPRDPASGKFIRPDGSLSDTPELAVADTFDGGQFNPDTLAPELQAGWKQLQAAYTQKTQQLAAERQQTAQAVELFNALQDPTYLQQFHAELSTHLQAQGLTSAEANVEAAQRIEAEVSGQATEPTVDLAALKADPELAPLAAALEAQQQRLDSFEEQAKAREEAEAMANWQMAVAGELQRQEMSILQANPHYTESDMDAVHELAAYFDGNLHQAQQRYEAIGQSLVDRYLNQKQQHVEGTPGAVTGTAMSEIPETLDSLDDGLRGALESLAQQGIDTIGA
jgi:hypothetical protein